MLANLNEVWKLADEKKIAIGAFNIVNFDGTIKRIQHTYLKYPQQA